LWALGIIDLGHGGLYRAEDLGKLVFRHVVDLNVDRDGSVRLTLLDLPDALEDLQQLLLAEFPRGHYPDLGWRSFTSKKRLLLFLKSGVQFGYHLVPKPDSLLNGCLVFVVCFQESVFSKEDARVRHFGYKLFGELVEGVFEVEEVLVGSLQEGVLVFILSAEDDDGENLLRRDLGPALRTVRVGSPPITS